MGMNRSNEIRPVLRPTIRLRSDAASTRALPSADSSLGRDVSGSGISGYADVAPNGSGSRIGNSIGESPIMSARDARAGDGGAGGSFFEAGSVWTPEQGRKSELIAAVRAIENKSTGGFTKFIVLLVSLAVFVAAGVAWWDPWMVSMLVVVLLFHEAGHYVAMRMFGYRNVKMFFIPFLGAAVSGRHFNISGWKKAMVYLAGPVPGIIVSLPLMTAGIALEKDWMLELGGMALLLNTLNLLPIMPLDGGWIMHLTVFSRSPILELVARVIGIVAMVAFSIFTESRFILFVAIPLVLSLPMTYRVAKLIRRLRDRPLPQPERDEIPDAAIHLLDDEIQATPLAPTPTANKAGIIVQMYESLIVRPPGFAATLAIWMVYGGAFVIAIVGGMGILVGRDLFRDGIFDMDMFDADSHSVPLDVDDTRFHLGTDPIDESYLAVARFESAVDLEAAKQRLSPEDLEKYTHVRFGNVWFASIPIEGDGQTEDELVVDDDVFLEDEFDDEFGEDNFDAVRERMRELFRPVDPAETWIANLAQSPNVGDGIDDVAGDVEGENGRMPRLGQSTVHVISGMHHSSIQIRAIAPDPETAKQVAEEYFQMPSVAGDRLYLPAWSPLDAPTQQQIDCRNVLKTLISGITPETAPELFEERKRLYERQYSTIDDDDYDPVIAAEFAAQIRDLQTKFTSDFVEGLDGEQAAVGRMYLRYQQDELAYQAKVEQRSIDIRARIAAGEELDENADSEMMGDEYPIMDDYLIGERNLLGLSDSSRRSHHFASHVSGDVLTAEDVMEEREYADQDADANVIALNPGERILNLHVHRATDQAATLSAIVAFLGDRGFHTFELQYVTPTADFE